MSFHDTEIEVIRWAMSKGIIGKATPHIQALKTVSELGELCDALIKGDSANVQMEMGDVVVCLIVLCAMLDIDLTDCLNQAYAKISKRQGTSLPNGVFVKSENHA